MDLKQFDVRGASETAVFMALVNPITGEALIDEDGNECGFMVRGSASHTAQQKLRKQRALQKRQGKKEDASGLEELHQASIDAALQYIVAGVNISFGGEEVGDSETLIRKVLDATYPEIKQVRDEDGTLVRDEAGNVVVTMTNKPFATQVIDFATEQANFLGERSPA